MYRNCNRPGQVQVLNMLLQSLSSLSYKKDFYINENFIDIDSKYSAFFSFDTGLLFKIDEFATS